jgi:drug/metabolite transporter (DMT)-like permease
VLTRKANLLAEAAGETFAGVGPGINAAYQRLLGGILISGLFLAWLRWAALAKGTEGAPVASPSRWRQAWPWLLANGLAGPALGVSCYQWALSTTPTGIVLPIIALTPLVVIPFARLMEGERLTVRSVAGGILAVAGAVALARLK